MKYIFLLATIFTATAYAADSKTNNRIYIQLFIERENSTAESEFFTFPDRTVCCTIRDIEKRKDVTVTKIEVREKNKSYYVEKDDKSFFWRFGVDSTFIVTADSNRSKPY